jgi:hypothetical protein
MNKNKAFQNLHKNKPIINICAMCRCLPTCYKGWLHKIYCDVFDWRPSLLGNWVLTRATRRNNPEDTILHSHRRENLKSYIGNCSRNSKQSNKPVRSRCQQICKAMVQMKIMPPSSQPRSMQSVKLRTSKAYEDFYLLRYNTVTPSRRPLTFWRNKLPLSLGSTGEYNKQETYKDQQQTELCGITFLLGLTILQELVFLFVRSLKKLANRIKIKSYRIKLFMYS